SLGHEVFAAGPGGGHSWLQEHVGSDYITGWVVPELRDIALVTSGISRWHNHYVEGLDWLVRHEQIDGLYLDDVAFDRTTMQRMRRVLARGRPHPMIDLHSANQFNPNDGFASSANLYLEHFPYIDRLWFGEYFDYNSAPDYWLVEMSGIPFGLMGEMLQDGGNPWRGMVFGMTARLPWAGDPRPLWQVWDQFGITEARMHGWWDPADPVKTGRDDVLATAYVKNGKTMIAVASWATDTAEVRLRIDWRALGLDPARTSIWAPAIDRFQEARTFRIGEAIPVAPGKGWVLIVE
ncbi:MAG TPA: glycoside hydrolase domain-containing protein, partial [Gemmatimonadales bacterium]|nr:glycoside hydrolase domain-containing protein [Gemmatimonadales bacterium]